MKRFFSILLAGILCLSLAACGGSSTPDTSTPNTDDTSDTTGEVITLTFTTSSVPEEAHTKTLVEYVKPRLEELSGGRITMEIYDSGSLFSQDDELPATIKGNASMCYTDGSWLDTYMPGASMFSAGYFFTSLDHMNAVMNGEIGETFFEQVAQQVGVRPLCCYYMGSRIINLRSEEPAVTPDMLSGVSLRMPNSEAWLMLGRALGANPVPIAFSELYTALSSGVVDGQDNPLTGTEEGKFYEVTGSIALTNHQIGAVWPAINEELWQSMDEELQGYVMQAFQEGIEYNNNIVLQKEADLVAFFEDEGLVVAEADIPAYKEQVMAYYLADETFTANWDMDLYEQIQALG